ncbi:ABC transporter substrate-binding protein [Candidatus Woesearchaeota archaeon]|nr:ABC transporter substrate-binding protein [Candidatus Woesearchaeota archaeon]
MMKKMSKILIGIAMILSLFLLSACGGGNKASGDDTLKVGLILALTGDVAVFGEPMRNAVQLAVEEVNAKGGVNGKRIQMIYEDGMCDGKQAAVAAQKLVHIDKVGFIIGGLCSAETLSIAPITEEKKVVLLSPSNDEWGVGLQGAFVAAAEKAGLEVVAVETAEPGAADVKTQILKIQSAGPDAIYMPLFPGDMVIALKQMSELGFTPFLMGADATKSDDLIAAGGDAVEGLVFTMPSTPKSPAYASFSEKYNQKYGTAEPNPYTAESYDAAMIAFNAYKNSDGTPEGLKAYLDSMGPYDGASGTFEFDEFGEVMKPYDFYVVKDGKFELFER